MRCAAAAASCRGRRLLGGGAAGRPPRLILGHAAQDAARLPAHGGTTATSERDLRSQRCAARAAEERLGKKAAPHRRSSYDAHHASGTRRRLEPAAGRGATAGQRRGGSWPVCRAARPPPRAPPPRRARPLHSRDRCCRLASGAKSGQSSAAPRLPVPERQNEAYRALASGSRGHPLGHLCLRRSVSLSSLQSLQQHPQLTPERKCT